MPFSYPLHVVFIRFVPNTGTRLVILGVLVAIHGRQDRPTPDHGLVTVSLSPVVDPQTPLGAFEKAASLLTLEVLH